MVWSLFIVNFDRLCNLVFYCMRIIVMKTRQSLKGTLGPWRSCFTLETFLTSSPCRQTIDIFNTCCCQSSPNTKRRKILNSCRISSLPGLPEAPCPPMSPKSKKGNIEAINFRDKYNLLTWVFCVSFISDLQLFVYGLKQTKTLVWSALSCNSITTFDPTFWPVRSSSTGGTGMSLVTLRSCQNRVSLSKNSNIQ